MSWKLFLLLLKAAGTTAAVSAASILLGFAIGLVVCACSLARKRTLRAAARLYVSFFRGVPLLVQLLVCYNLLPSIGLDVSSEAAAVIALSLCTAAYQAENLRGGFLSVPQGLIEAAEVVGMSPWQRFRRVRAPIALGLTVPAIVNEAIAILQASAMISVIGVVELTRTAQDLSASTFRPLTLYAMASVLYLAMGGLLSASGTLAERQLRSVSA